ncbi:MAG TPA: 3-hydroxyacyl-CoA dehydrogenase NAD-binding domain-containing protein, partial [Candidatus Polarisedimenticolaceae bacterium]|nr:3-hydroxyacyl-CoA dehydrogenase NAD-binding domain-containing protein [Candidatus Polarisedimenticolaceae bacterium]
IGLPEVQIGIIPGFGGSQRLPRLIALPAAIDLILTGKRIDARRARRLGLVDAVVPPAYLEREAVALLERAIEVGVARAIGGARRRKRPVERLIESVPPLRRWVLDHAHKKTEQRIRARDYPAPFRALEAIEAALTKPLPEGLDLEARIVGELVPTQTSKNLIWLFKSQSALKSADVGLQATPRTVRRVAVLGAGVMGGGIAQAVAQQDLPVRLKDIRPEPILAALRTAREIWDRQQRRGRIDEREIAQKMANISPTADDTGLVHADLVLEAVVENLDVKRKVLAEAERRIDARAVFASNTSSLPISDIASRAIHPERVVGLHFFNPVHRMPLVEVIAGRHSSPEAVATVRAFSIRLGKVPVLVRDEPGFLVNRILTFYLNEAMVLLSEGVRIEAVDEAMTGFGMPVGPFALLDQVGLDTARHVEQVLAAAFGSRLGASASPLEVMVAAGRLGQKSAKGFYRYRDAKRTTVDGEVYKLLGVKTAIDLPAETIQERLLLTMTNEAAVCLQESVAREPRDVDLALVLGTGFPPFRGGLLRHADWVGIPIVADRLSRLADAHGERFRPTSLLTRMVRDQRRFYPDQFAHG